MKDPFLHSFVWWLFPPLFPISSGSLYGVTFCVSFFPFLFRFFSVSFLSVLKGAGGGGGNLRRRGQAIGDRIEIN